MNDAACHRYQICSTMIPKELPRRKKKEVQQVFPVSNFLIVRN